MEWFPIVEVSLLKDSKGLDNDTVRLVMYMHMTSFSCSNCAILEMCTVGKQRLFVLSVDLRNLSI